VSENVCPECGFHFDTVMPLDAIRALRSYPRRYRALFTGFDQDEDGNSLLRRRPDDSTPSALEYAAQAADRIDATGPLIRRMAFHDESSLPEPAKQRRDDQTPDNERPMQQVFAELETGCADLPMTLEAIEDEDWNRVAEFPSGQRDVFSLVREAVHVGSHNLRAMERVLAEVRGRSSESDW
jgi:hypothetical protein